MGGNCQTVSIYGLICPLDNQIRYIGSTIDIELRYKTHCAAGVVYPRNNKDKWLSLLKKKKIKPELIILEEVNREGRLLSEYFWLDYFRMIGAVLYNKCGVKKNPL